MNLAKAKIALVFDWMTNPGGAEKVNLVLHQMFSDAPIFTSIFNHKKIQGFENAEIHTSFIQNLPFAKTNHQIYLGLMPHAYELFDLSNFDIVISSSHSCAKGIITKPETMHICYCHTPMRYAWDNWQSYFKEYKMNSIFKKLGRRKMHKLRIWDRLAAERVDYFIANSSTVKKRIAKYYNKPSTVIHPMIDVASYKIGKKSEDFFLAVGRLIPYKKFDIIIDAFNKLGYPLKIVGTGIMERELQKVARSNIEFLGYIPDDQLKELYSKCQALIFPQIEDFGLTPIEAMACGKPVIAFNQGGTLDTVLSGKTGLFFHKQDANHLKEAVEEFKKQRRKFDPLVLRQHAQKFDRSEFEKKLKSYLEEKWEYWQKTMR